MPPIPSWSPVAFAAVALALLWIAEGLFPFVVARGAGWRRRLLNLGAGLFAYGLTAVIMAGATLWVTLWAAREGFGLMHVLDWHWAVEWAIVFVVLDAFAYVWHIACHKWRWLWRFHVVHHHDEQVDATTAFRFHIGEVVVKAVINLPVLALLGATIPQLLLVETVTVVMVAFHHANIRLPGWLEISLRVWTVTPAMHVVHHSRWQPETDSNYGAVFSFWDRIFGTFRLRKDPRRIDFGIDGYTDKDVRTFVGILKTPLAIKSEHGEIPEEFRPAADSHTTTDRRDAQTCAVAHDTA